MPIGMSQQPLVSVIVAVYNTQRYLPQCVESVFAQTYTHWELLLVDDGSTDGSPALCDGYAQKDARVRVTHKANTGQPDSVNNILRRVEGEFVCLLDSDDWIEPNFMEVLLNAVQQTGRDSAACGWFEDYQDGQFVKQISTTLLSLDCGDAIRPFYDQRLYSFLCGKLFGRGMTKEPIPHMPRHYDQAVLYRWIGEGNGMAFCPEVMYHYRQRGGSIMNSRAANRTEFVPLIKDCYQYVRDKRLLSEAENKAIASRQYLRIAKDLSRNRAISLQEAIPLLKRIQAEMDELGFADAAGKCPLKVRRRAFLLRLSPTLFWFMMRVGGLFVRRHDKASAMTKFE